MMSDKIMHIAAWVTFPLSMLVMEDSRKWLRLSCFAISIIIPLWVVGFVIYMVGVFVMIYEEL